MNLVPIKWKIENIDPKYDAAFCTLKISRRGQLDSPDKYSVNFMSHCLSREIQWEIEPLGSSRDDNFIAKCRFDSFAAAQTALSKAINKGMVEVNGHKLNLDGSVTLHSGSF